MGWFGELSGTGKALVTGAVLLIGVLGHAVFDHIRYSRPRRFRFEGRVYLFQPDRYRGFWRYRWKHGHFVHEDGSPIADEALAARVMRGWLNSFSGGDISGYD
jgi:hypothetical protein